MPDPDRAFQELSVFQPPVLARISDVKPASVVWLTQASRVASARISIADCEASRKECLSWKRIPMRS